MRSEKELAKECNLHHRGDEEAFLTHLKSIAEKNLLENNLTTARMFLTDIQTLKNIIKRRS